MFDTKGQPPAPHPDAGGADRVGKPSPIDLRKHRFRVAMRGFDREQVTTFVADAAQVYEQAVRDADELRHKVARLDAQLADHRGRETMLRDTLLTAQRLADEVRETAHQEARLIIREAEARAEMLLQKAQGRLEQYDRDITELRLRRRDVELSLEASISALQHALECICTRPAADEHSAPVGERPPQHVPVPVPAARADRSDQTDS